MLFSNGNVNIDTTDYSEYTDHLDTYTRRRLALNATINTEYGPENTRDIERRTRERMYQQLEDMLYEQDLLLIDMKIETVDTVSHQWFCVNTSSESPLYRDKNIRLTANVFKKMEPQFINIDITLSKDATTNEENLDKLQSIDE
jgi:hypothetical protein